MKTFLLALVLTALAVATAGDEGACDPLKCKENCSCFSMEPPAKLSAAQMPQFVMLAFDGAVNINNMPYYKELMGKKNKKSGCNIGATFFVNHEYLDYSLLHDLYINGHEIGLHSITHVADRDYWTNLTTAGWEAEIAKQRDLVANLAKVNSSDIKGVRAPFLYTGGDNSFEMLKKANFEYDASLPHMRAKGTQDPAYPYTLDYGLKSSCMIPPCPEKQYKGLWSVPMNMYFKALKFSDTITQDVPCSMVDACVPAPATGKETLEYLKDNFAQFYEANRAPFPLFLHQAWLQEPERKQGFNDFIDFLLKKDDVFMVTIQEVIEFMKHPTPLSNYKEKRCVTKAVQTTSCNSPKSCNYADSNRFMKVCSDSCPSEYPWVTKTSS